jgi:nucleoside-diphosphate-sugar epimerase
MLNGKRIVITGGAGFIGTSLAARIADHNQVVLFDNFARNALDTTHLRSHPNVSVVKGDVLDPAAVSSAVKGAHVVVHMASIAGVDTVMKKPVLTMRVSLQGTINVLDAAHAAGSVERFIDFSTSEVFGRFAHKVTEADTPQLGVVGEARWTYAVSKLATEHLALNFHKEYGFPALSIRPFNIYGPGQVGEGAIHHFIVRAIRGEDITVHNDGAQIRSWCYIDDIVEGILLAMEKKEAVGHAFNIGNPRGTITIYALAELIIRLCGSTSRIRLIPWDFPDVELRIPNINKARELLGYEPEIGLEQGILRTIEWYRTRAGVPA